MNVSGKEGKSSGGAPTGRRKGKGSSVAWFNPKPDASDVALLDGQEDNYVTHVIELLEGLQARERLSVKFEPQSGRWLAILFVDPSGEGGTVHALSVRGATAFDATVLLHYFHHVKFEDGWGGGDSEVSGRFG